MYLRTKLIVIHPEEVHTIPTKITVRVVNFYNVVITSAMPHKKAHGVITQFINVSSTVSGV